MVGVLVRWKWKGEKKSKSKKERTKESNSQTDLILYHSQTTERKKKDNIIGTYTYTHIIQVCYRDTDIPEISTFLPPTSYLLDYIKAFNINVTARSYNTYTYVVSLIIIIPYNKTDKPVR